MLSLVIIVISFICIFMCSMWIAIAVALDDHSVPTRANLPFTNILVVYPHPDDESLTSGGLVHMLSMRGIRTTLLLLTKGECGTPDASLKLSLKRIRTKEAEHSAKALGFSELISEDMGDGQLMKKKAQVKKKVGEVMGRIKPDLVISYDRSGMYGHPDHMVVADVITELVAEKFKKTTLWYVSFPKYVLATIKLPTHMAKNSKFMSLRLQPTHRVFIGYHVIAKIQSLMSHTCQLPSFKKSLPVKFMPLWFPHSARLFEYYAEINPARSKK